MYHDLNGVECEFFHALHWVDKLSAEYFETRCKKGDVVLEPLNRLLPYFRPLKTIPLVLAISGAIFKVTTLLWHYVSELYLGISVCSIEVSRSFEFKGSSFITMTYPIIAPKRLPSLPNFF